MTKIIGIDFGATNSCVAIMEGDSPIVITNSEGARITPSVIGFTDSKRLVGASAKRQAITNPDKTLYSIKRFIGRKYSEVISEIAMVPYKVKESSNGDAVFEVDGKIIFVEDAAALIFIKMKESAEVYLGEKVTEAVITVPAHFNDSQCQAIKNAGKIAGLNVKRIIPEPTAAALAYGLDAASADKKFVVYDLGGSTFNVSILESNGGVFEVLAINGDLHLGGDDFNEMIVQSMLDGFKNEHGIDLSKDKMAVQRLHEAAEKAKIELSAKATTEIKLPFIAQDASGPKHLATTFSREKFENLSRNLVERTVAPCLKVMKDGGVTKENIGEVILVGGMTRMPAVQDKVKEIFGKDPHKDVNPDEAVAIGSAIQGGIIAGDVKDVLLLDTVPITLGIETAGGIFTPFIRRNMTFPTQKKQVLSLDCSSPSAVTVVVLQGERPMSRGNRVPGCFELKGILPDARGAAQIEVCFDVDKNGILRVSAKDHATGNEQGIIINATPLD